MKNIFQKVKNGVSKTGEVLGRAKDFPEGYTLKDYLTPSIKESLVMGFEGGTISPLIFVISSLITNNPAKGFLWGATPQALTYIYYRGKELFGENKGSVINEKFFNTGKRYDYQTPKSK